MKRQLFVFMPLMLIAMTASICADEMGKDNSLPVIPVNYEVTVLGSETILVYDMEDLKNANPWNENSEIETLPVFRNGKVCDENGRIIAWDSAEMEKMLDMMVSNLGGDERLEKLIVYPNGIDQETLKWISEKNDGVIPKEYLYPQSILYQDEEIRVRVKDTLELEITYLNEVSLPDGFVFQTNATYEELCETALYLQERFQPIWGEFQCLVDINGGDYTYDGQQQWRIEFFYEGKSLEESIVNYNFNRTRFLSNGNDCLWSICMYHQDISEKVGDYPVISVEQATELLLNYKFWTTAVYLPEEEGIGSVELVYRTGNENEYFVPHYRFWVEDFSEENSGKLKRYTAFYVPAIAQEYIE